VLPTAHDMAREHRIIAALGPTGLPMPPALGLCEDVAVNGASFYVMGYVDGLVVRTEENAARLDEGARHQAGESLIDVLVGIHDVDVDAVGLGTLARKEGYIARQLKRWYGQYEGSKAMGGPDVPEVDKIHDLLAERIPEQIGATIVHGDYRLDNCIVGLDGHVRAVLDWEICTLGDPLADVGLLMVYWAEPGDEFAPLPSPPTIVPGFSTRDELKQRYAEQSGRNVDQLDFYVAFAYWKLACIIEGVYARYAGGAGGGDQTDHTGMSDQVFRLAQAAADTATRLK
jgi:aminoglycoside phosphotransferase (APT) family kinase protein